MPRTFYQTAGSTGACTALATRKVCDESGPADASSISVAANGSNVISHSVTCEPSDTNWAAGNIDVEFDVTVSNMNLTLNAITVSRYTSGCVDTEEIGTLSGIARSMGATGSVTHTVPASGSAASSTDKLVIEFSFTNSNSMSAQGITASVGVTTSNFDAPANVTGSGSASIPALEVSGAGLRGIIGTAVTALSLLLVVYGH